ncbi:C-C motif chemokine 3-like 1 [Stegastes partitus]|uniref:C-C motif chemokine 3-like 1 n=1 Tax=Stegastes partitus TaxID=144197 RepID=A0A9Y4NFB7_9TELE|nr:PREDICTED: C-C motif chemokine 3-like 1 [Stegastes partitus]
MDAGLSQHHSRHKTTKKQKQKKKQLILLTMKTLCLTLLLLSVYCCCDAMPAALQATAPGRCCFGFQTRSLPLRLVSGVVRTHSACLKPAFIVRTIRGRDLCYSQTSQWALDVYNRTTRPEGSGQ